MFPPVFLFLKSRLNANGGNLLNLIFLVLAGASLCESSLTQVISHSYYSQIGQNMFDIF